ncbi:unnamed protein product [Strongylus vulgaris]|uniref:Uncharacterized protein n=1 Tax=Strongylus vulgaris TaxID=40348 RepID=A0A3P7JSU8_STRVU|nr:unnamed protein product [Strongylus vulgaris]
MLVYSDKKGKREDYIERRGGLPNGPCGCTSRVQTNFLYLLLKLSAQVFKRLSHAIEVAMLLLQAKYWPGAEEFAKARIMKKKYLEDPLAKELLKPKEVVGDDPIPLR